MKILIPLLTIFLYSGSAFSQAPTWEKQISCIVYSHCTSCHNPNGLAPFSLTSYQAAFNKRYSILNAVMNNEMPPYLPDVNYRHLANAKILTDEEKTLINDWVTAGAPAGDTSLALPPPVYTQNQVITSPDLTGKIPNFTIPNTGADLYQAFIISSPNTSVKYITQIEVIPGNRNVVHHVLVYQDSTNKPVVNDSAYPGPGYVSFGGIGSQNAKLVATWVPGSGVYTLPAGMGIRLSPGSRLVVQIHYPNGSAGQIDSTRINVKFSSALLRDVSIAPVLNPYNMTNAPLFIPANTTKTFYAQEIVPINVSLLAVGPHAHLICKKFEVFGIPLVGDTIKLIKIDNWDFHWQGAHSFQKPIKIPAGTKLHSIAFYDNTVNNPDNPNNPPQDVSQGEATTDEMMLIYFSYLPYQSGDENIIFDTASHNEHYLNCIPKPIGLPVSYLYFNAQQSGKMAQLTWATAQEHNSSHFIIERSTNSADFISIGKMKAAGFSQTKNTYTFSEPIKDYTKLYYRIKQVDFDGKFYYTPVRLINADPTTVLTVYPNPVRQGEQIIISPLTQLATKVIIYNALGQIVHSQTNIKAQSGRIALNAGLPKGQYIVQIHFADQVSSSKLVVQ